jgi:hypothetical protein
MSKVRTLLGGVILTLLTLGYLASQYAYFYGDPVDYAARIDQPQVKLLSLILFVALLVLAVVPDKGEEE